MSRRDTIIIAALLNAGLLIVLFTTALKTDAKAPAVASIHASPSFEKVDRPVRKEPPIQPQGDEVDQVLRDYGQAPKVPDLAPALPKMSPAPIVAAPSPSSFADEINAIALPSSEPAAAPAFAATPPPSDKAAIDVTVKKGDVLEKIARTHNTTVDLIMKQNQLTSSNLRIGQVLKVTPNQTSQVAKKEQTAPVSSEGSSKYYTVKSGDNPWTIAVKNHMKVDELLKLNNLDAEKARRLKPGDQLRIR